MPTNEKVGGAIRELREKKTKLTQEAFAARANVHRTHMSKIENGEGSIKLDTLWKIARALKIHASEILKRAEKEAG